MTQTPAVDAWMAETLMAMDARTLLLAGLDGSEPSWASEGRQITHCPAFELVQALDSGRFDVAVADCRAPDLDWSLIAPMLARLQHVLAERVLVLTPAEIAAPEKKHLRSQGFGLAARCADASVYDYSVATYNEPREWNNAEHWAHPENFGKRRW